MQAYDYLFKWILWLLAINPVLTTLIVIGLAIGRMVSTDPDDDSKPSQIKKVIVVAATIEGIVGFITFLAMWFQH